MKRISIVAAICILTIPLLLAAQTDISFNGTWVLDRAKSETNLAIAGGGAGPLGGGRGGLPDANLTLIINQTDKAVEVIRKAERNGKETTITQTFVLDGSPTKNPLSIMMGESTTKSSLKKGKLVNLSTQTLQTQMGEMTIDTREEFSLSKDGRVLTINTTRTTQLGDMTTKQVFNKKD
jgi:hypothetical protein